jgi:hypothetical protein
MFALAMSGGEKFDRPVGAWRDFWLIFQGLRFASPLAIDVCPFGAKFGEFSCAKIK